MSDFALSYAERNTPLWRKLRRHLERERAELRERNDNSQLDERTTAEIRGRIGQVNDLLALDESPAPEVEG